MIESTREKEKVEGINDKVQLINEQVEAWCSRVIQKIDQQFNENIGSYHDKTIGFSFVKIEHAIAKQLEQIIHEEDDEDRGFITSKDFMTDFATDDFVNKNIRVRPQSGINRDMNDDARGGGDAAASRHEKDAFGNVEDDDQYNKGVNMDLEIERDQIIKRKEAYELKKKEDEERDRKKRM